MNAPKDAVSTREIAAAAVLDASSAVGPRASLAPTELAELLASLAHAMRSPVGVISGALSELRFELTPSSTDEQRLLGSLADRGLLRLRHLADVLSLASSLASPAFELRLLMVDLTEILRTAVATARALEPRREVEITVELPLEGRSALVDADRLARGVSEIVINAIRFAVKRVRVRLQADPGDARITIEDDGAGVAEALRPTLFSRVAARRSLSGLGMGLSIAGGVIAAHGGLITLEASALPAGRRETTGAQFVISLPQDRNA